ncbi:MAG: RpiB/LacA/LacB family sugar-phosphate isomerase [Actinobacteria bacterium]|nr:RpiB/LacA/LacB family sugar-phosphate isomerase [Actinomycetota bacterium]
MIYLGADHGGYELKEEIKRHLKDEGIDFEDLGTYSTESVDYPDYAFAVSDRVANGNLGDFGVLVCTTATGTCIAANKVRGIKGAVGYSEEVIQRARNDTDANVLCLGGGAMEHSEAIKGVDIFIRTPFSYAGRHVRRINKIKAREELEFGGAKKGAA